MDLIKKTTALREFNTRLERFELVLSTILDDAATPSQADRWRLTTDAAARLRRQIGHLTAELVLAEGEPPENRPMLRQKAVPVSSPQAGLNATAKPPVRPRAG
jgi:hypothetical protein